MISRYSKKPKLLLLIGESGSGKDELYNYLYKHKQFKKLFKPSTVAKLSGGDLIKKVATEQFNWLGTKNPNDRRLFKYITTNGRYKYQKEFREKNNFYDILNIDKSIEDNLSVCTSFYAKVLINQALQDKKHDLFVYTDVRFIDEYRITLDADEQLSNYFDIYYVLITIDKSSDTITDEEINELMERSLHWKGESTFCIHNDKTKNFYTQIDVLIEYLNCESDLHVNKLVDSHVNTNSLYVTINDLEFNFFKNLHNFNKLSLKEQLKVYLVYNYIVCNDIYVDEKLADKTILNLSEINITPKYLNLYNVIVSELDAL